MVDKNPQKRTEKTAKTLLFREFAIKMCSSSRNLFCVGLGDNFTAKYNETVPVKTAKSNFVAFLVFSETVASFTAKICSSVTVANFAYDLRRASSE